VSVQTSAPARRHRWVKLRLHVYVCRHCGTGKENSQAGGGWIQTYHQPTGRSVVLSKVPACEAGPHTARYLAKHAAMLAVPF
jgi:hypothetical protein